MNILDSTISLPFIFSALGAAGGLLLQQAIELWKTRAAHRQELQRRFFEIKFQTAIDVAQSLDAVVAAQQARLAEALEWTRDDEKFGGWQISRDVLSLHGKSLEKEYTRYMAAFAVLDLVFSEEVVAIVTETSVGLDLTNALREFDDTRLELVRELEKLIPDERMEEFRQQRRRGQFEQGTHGEMVQWMAVYKAGVAQLRSRLPHLAELTRQSEDHRKAVIRAIRHEMKPYQV